MSAGIDYKHFPRNRQSAPGHAGRFGLARSLGCRGSSGRETRRAPGSARGSNGTDATSVSAEQDSTKNLTIRLPNLVILGISGRGAKSRKAPLARGARRGAARATAARRFPKPVPLYFQPRSPRRGHPGIPHGTRTHKLRIRGPIPCQFGQGPPGKEFWRQVGTQRRKPENNNFEGRRWEFPRERVASPGATSAASPAGGGHQCCARSA